ncbi:hypothetical protein HOD75_02885 [archaeon]|jgi:hypothetical protein|nr:hypothetical protein [archaeon]MBT4241819.1 hypothetical protein [archaeon]MBT4418367.1 hypothetical protein [archaeon]
MARPNNERDHCPICGRYLDPPEFLTHKCNPRVLGGIDGANTRAIRYEEEAFSKITAPTYSDKLKEGFKHRDDI